MKYIIALALTCALGLLTRASFLSMIMIAFFTVFIVVMRDPKENGLLKLKSLTKYFSLITATIVLGAGWFYRINYAKSGSILGRHADYGIENMGRITRPIFDVLTDPNFLLFLPNRLFVNAKFSLIMFSLGFILIILVILKKSRKPNYKKIIFSLALIQFILVVFQQAYYFSGGGANIIRYYLPSILFITLCLGLPLIKFKLLRGQLIIPLLIIMALNIINNSIEFNFRWKSEGNIQILNYIKEITGRNEYFPDFNIYLILSTFIIGLILISVSMYQSTRPSYKH